MKTKAFVIDNMGHGVLLGQTHLNSMIREGLSKKVTFIPNLEG